MPIEDTKPCSVLVETIPEGNKTTTVTITTMQDSSTLIPTEAIPHVEDNLEEIPEKKPATIAIPGFGEVPSEDTKPCIISTKPISDGYNTTLITTTIMASRDVPGKDENVPLSWKDINISGLTGTPQDCTPGVFVSKDVGDPNNPITIIGTLVTTDDGTPIPDEMPRGQNKPSVVTSKVFKEGDTTTTVTTTMVPMQDLPNDYQFTTGDLRERRFPGFEGMPIDDTKPCSVLVETIPEGNKTTIVTITTMQDSSTLIPTEAIPHVEDNLEEIPEKKPETITIPGFGEVPTEETKQCIINAQLIKQGDKTTLMTTTIMTSKDVPGETEGVPLGWKDIETTGFIDRPDDSAPGIYVSKKIIEDSKPTTITGTLVTSNNKKPVYPVREDLQKGQDRKGIVTTKTVKKGDKTTTVTTTVVPMDDLPKDYTFTSSELSDGKFPGFNQMPPEKSKPCTVATEAIPEGSKTTTISITKLAVDERPLLIEFPGFGTVPTEETIPCVVEAKTITDGSKATVMTTTVTAISGCTRHQ